MNDSFFVPTAWNRGTDACKQESCSTSVSVVHEERHSASTGMQEQISASVVNDTNSGGSVLFQMSTCPSVTMTSGENSNTGVKPGPVITSADSRLLTHNTFDTVGITPTEARMLKDVYCQIVGSRQVSTGHNVKDAKQSSPTKDSFTVNRPVRGKENIQPFKVTKLNSRKHLNSERTSVNLLCSEITALSSASKHDTQCTGNQECSGMKQWASPLRRSVNDAENGCLDQRQSFSQRSDKEKKVPATSKSFSALSLASDDSVVSCVDQNSQSKFSENGLHTNADEVYKRSSSTPVKDESLQEPVRFRRRQHSGSSCEASKEQRQSSLQHFGEASVSASEINEPFMRQNKQSSQAVQGTMTQSGDEEVKMNADIFAERLSCGALSTGSLPDDYLIAGNLTYESTVLLSLPGNVNAAETIQDTSCSEVGTQTSFLLPSDRKKTSILSTSGSRELCCFITDVFCFTLLSAA